MQRLYILCFIVMFLFIVPVPQTQAADFTVNDAASLIAAINTANANGEADVITLSANITLTATNNVGTFGNNGLPVIVADGGNSLTINGNGFTINRASASNFRIIEIASGANLTLNNLTVSNGTADAGGGIYNNGTLTVNNSIISDNIVASVGGGINNNGTLTVNNSTISDNEARADYGGGINNDGTLTVNNSTISGNFSIDGGGINNDGALTVNNSTISGNTTDGIGNDGGTLRVNNSTISGNSAAGIVLRGSLTVTNSIIAGNTGTDCYLLGTFIANANNVFGTNGNSRGCTAGATDIVPAGGIATILASLGNNGGPTQTHALVAGSPAIDAANNANCPASDQRGAERGVDGDATPDSPQPGDCDIGAFEFTGTVPTVTIAPVSSTSFAESGGTASITVAVADLAAGDSITILANVSGGTATVDTDYTITESLTFNANGTQDFIITGLTDALVEGDETLTVSFSLLGAANISGNGNQTVTILDGVAPLLFSKAFAPDTINVGDSSSLTFTIDNTANTVDATGLDFTDNLPAGMTVATPANASTTCTGGTITAVSGSGTISYTGGTVGAGASCIVVVDVIGNRAGALVNTTGLTSSLGNSATASDTLTVASPPSTGGNPEISVFDPAISKLGLLVPGQTGVAGEQLEWIVTVSNTGNVAGNNVVVTDTLIDALRVDSVDAPGANVTINGQTVSVTYATLNVGETVQFSIFTTVLDGATVENRVCINASNQGTEECATAIPIGELPATGERAFSWNHLLWLLIAAIAPVLTILPVMLSIKKRKL